MGRLGSPGHTGRPRSSLLLCGLLLKGSSHQVLGTPSSTAPCRVHPAERFQPPGPGHPFIHGSLQGASCLIPPPTSLAGPLELLTSPSPIHGAPSSPPLSSGTHYAQSRDHPRSLVGSHPTPPITFMAPYSLWMNPGSSLLPVPSPRTPPLASQLLLPRAPLSAHSITLPCAGNHGYLGTLRKEQAMLHKLGTGFIAEPQRPCTLCNYSWEVGKGST